MTENPIFDALNTLEGALLDLDHARFTLAHLVEEEEPDISPHIIQCVIVTLGEVASSAKTGLDVVSEELKDKRFPALAEGRS